MMIVAFASYCGNTSKMRTTTFPRLTTSRKRARSSRPTLQSRDARRLFPRQGGRNEFAREIRQAHNCGIIMISGRADSKEQLSMLNTAVDDTISKPLEQDEVLARARAVLRRYGVGRRAGKEEWRRPGRRCDVRGVGAQPQAPRLDIAARQASAADDGGIQSTVQFRQASQRSAQPRADHRNGFDRSNRPVRRIAPSICAFPGCGTG